MPTCGAPGVWMETWQPRRATYSSGGVLGPLESCDACASRQLTGALRGRRVHGVVRDNGLLQRGRRAAALSFALGAIAAAVTVPVGVAGAATAPSIQIPPSISGLRIKPSALVAAARGPSALALKAAARGAIVSYSAFAVATTTFAVQRALAGRRRGHRCVKPASAGRKAKRCTRYLRLGSFQQADNIALGVVHFRFTGRVGGRALKPGSYRMQAVPKSAAGLTGPAAFAPFSVMR